MIDFAVTEALDASRVLADALQSAGDPRGELLALELASHTASSCEQARRLNRRAQQLREAEHERVWPHELPHREPEGATLRVRAGFIVEIHAAWLSDLDPLDTSPDVGQLRALHATALVDLPGRVRPTHLSLLPPPEDPPVGAGTDSIAQLEGLRSLLSSHWIDANMEAQLAGCSELEALALLSQDSQGTLPSFEHLDLLHLELRRCRSADLAALGRWAQLRSLRAHELAPLSPADEPALFDRLAELSALEHLRIDEGGSAPSWRDLLPRLEQLRSVELLANSPMGDHTSWYRAHRSLAALPQLESLAAASRFVDRRLLDQLPKLRRLRLWASHHEAGRSRRGGSLPPLEHLGLSVALLEGLRSHASPSLAIFGADLPARPSLWSRILALPSPVPLRALTLVSLRPGPIPEAALPRLAALEELRLEYPPRKLAELEQLAKLPCLRRLRITGRVSIDDHRALCRALPAVLVETTSWWPRSSS